MKGFVEPILTAALPSARSTRTGRAGTTRSCVVAVVVRQDPLVAPARLGIAARAVLAHPDAVAPAAPVDEEERARARLRGQAEDDRQEEQKPPHQAGQGIAALRSATMPIQKLLVANRGEIAVRVFRTCRELGIATVAVAAPDDRGSLHARSADETVEIESYLFSEEHIRAAKQAGADAIHPGYGFLAENADFAEAVEAAGLIWVGPPPEALRLGGDKLAAKQDRRRGRRARRPRPASRPSSASRCSSRRRRAAAAEGCASSATPAELDEALAAARREAEAAFGDGTVFCERYVERPRHVEIQLLADAHGTVLALGERECSVQRRHQKVLEESPVARRSTRSCAPR